MPLPEVTWTPEFEETHTFYDSDGQDRLGYDSLYEYLEERICDDGLDLDNAIAQNWIVSVIGYDRMKLDRKCCEFLDRILERISEEDGMCDPDGDGLEIRVEDMTALQDLESKFIDELENRFIPWGCIPVVKIKVPFRDWWESLTDKDREILRG